jgi:PAS domain S-box-containing protein
MRHESKTKKELIDELKALRKRLARLEDQERQQAELDEALFASQEKLRLLSEASFETIFIHENGVIIEANGKFATMFGYQLNEVIGKHVLDFAAPESRQLILNNVETGYDNTYQAMGLRKDGSTFLGELRGKTLMWRGKKIRVTALHDITERTMAEETLKETVARLRTIVCNAPIVLFSLDARGIFTLSEGRGLNALNLKPGQVVGQSVYEIYRDVPQIIDNLKQAYSGEEVTDIVEVAGIYFEAHYIPMRDEKDNIVGIIGVATDISEHKKMEEKLAAEKERLAVTLRSIGDGVIAADAQGRIMLINEMAEKLTGWSQEEALGRPLREVFHVINEKTRQRIEDPVEKVLATGAVITLAGNLILISKRQAEKIISDSIAPIRNQKGEILGVVLVFRDNTEKKKLAEEMLKASKLESIGVLAGGIAHDFNNFLAAIIGNLTLAKSSLDPSAELYKRMTEIEKASLMAKDLTQQLLTFAKGGAPIIKAASIGELLKESAIFALRGSNVICEFSLPDDLWPVEIDTTQMSQVINNLVINAQQAMPAGGVINISAENIIARSPQSNAHQTAKYVSIAITDQGVGIARENLARIFDPFFTTKQGGSGLGLATSYSIIKKHEGSLSVESEVGKGATFFITLPASKKKIKSQRSVESKKSTIGAGKILVMDDKEILRELAHEILTGLGYQVGLASDGAETIRLYRDAQQAGQPFDLVIMDLTVPGGMGGKDAIKALLEIDPDVKAIVSSGYSHDAVMSDYQQYGFCAVLVKPYRMEELRKILARVLAGDSI